MRFYSFSNMYLSSLQVGLQSAHVISDMFVKYPLPEDATPAPAFYLHHWAGKHKTMILLNGGYSETLRNLIEFFDQRENPYPWDSFNESEDALDGALTCVGIVLPEKIYEASAFLRTLGSSDESAVLSEFVATGTLTVLVLIDGNLEPVTHDFNRWEYNLIQKLNEFGMAK